ncbi:PREDICTED: L-asparaginase-like [Acropora digitifera]|uniref:L-asparaginase-like n=1 Tax=Acropora digitifera TaxID=70779 RepID=UPI00077AE298|nr:PREDICTED: L-asparaginase-like [Acropora digitifera]
MLSSASPGTSEQSVGPQQSVNAQVSRNFFRSRSSSYCSSVDGSSCQLGHRLGTVAVEDPLTHEKVVKSKVLLLYTGGALGWKVDPQDASKRENNFECAIPSYPKCIYPFFFVNLQYGLSHHLNDGRQNLLGAIMIAGHYVIPEVTLFFHGKLYRGNRVLKVDARRFGAFDSPNCLPLATVEADIEVEWEELFLENQASKFRVHKKMSSRIGVLRIFPGITSEAVRAFLEPPIEGVVLETYGAGNGPDSRQDLLEEIKTAVRRGVIVVNCTQCLQGHVVDDYSTGRVRYFDCSRQLSFFLFISFLCYMFQMMKTNMRGELTVYKDEKIQQFCLRDNELVDAVASHFKVGSTEEVRFIKRAIFPVLMCDAAGRGDTETMKELCGQGGVLNATASHDGRTPLHVACLEGQLSVIRHLLANGASPHVTDHRGQTPLHGAIRSANVEAISLLREFGAHLGPTTMDTALEMCALAADDNVDALRSWYLAGVNFNIGDYDRRTALHVAVCQNNVKTVKFLLECGVDPNVRDLYGYTPLKNAEVLENEVMIAILQSAMDARTSAVAN